MVESELRLVDHRQHDDRDQRQPPRDAVEAEELQAGRGALRVGVALRDDGRVDVPRDAGHPEERRQEEELVPHGLQEAEVRRRVLLSSDRRLVLTAPERAGAQRCNLPR